MGGKICCMRTWMYPWLFPLGALVTVALVSLFPTLPASVLAVVWGWILFPSVLCYLRSRGRGRAREDAAQEIDAPYWRITLR